MPQDKKVIKVITFYNSNEVWIFIYISNFYPNSVCEIKTKNSLKVFFLQLKVYIWT